MKFVALVSGGKDSIYSILECIRNGHELVACIHLGAPESTDEESYMYQTAASEVVRCMVEECMQVPLVLYQRIGKSINTSLVYQNESENDEVEDLACALLQAKEKFDFSAVSSGALFSTYQRVRIEHVCSRLGLTSLSYLWRLLPQKEMLQKMLEDGIEAVLVRVASPPGLLPQKHLNKTLSFLWHTGLLERLNQRYQFQVCGEGGEYESLVIDSPLHKKKLVLDEVTIDETDTDEVGVLRILKCHAEEKTESDIPILNLKSEKTKSETETDQRQQDEIGGSDQSHQIQKYESLCLLPTIREVSGGLIHISEIMAPHLVKENKTKNEADLAVVEALQVFGILRSTLQTCGASVQDVMFVHLYLSEISHFATINAHYQEFFGSLLPPSRSCVAVGKLVIPGGRRVLLDCIIQKGSGDYMRSLGSSALAVAAHATVTSKLREVLHVQSISNWAPVCVGPYSQCNTLRSALHFLAGQIGLKPSTMTLRSSWNLQLEQCWQNIASVLDALNGSSLDHLFSGLIYVVPRVFQQPRAIDEIRSITNKQISKNGSIVPGRIDSTRSDLYGGYEDEGTWQELEQEQKEASSPCPLLLVSIPEMPKQADIEVEVVTRTRQIASIFQMQDVQSTQQWKTNRHVATSSLDSSGWDTGHSFPEVSEKQNSCVQIDVTARVIGHRCAASVLAIASSEMVIKGLQPTFLLSDMFSAVDKVLASARSGLTHQNLLNVRLFYPVQCGLDSNNDPVRDDGIPWRASLQAAVASWSNAKGSCAATTVVPVQGINVLNFPSHSTPLAPFIAMQILFLDPVHMETEQIIFNGDN